MTHHLGYVSTSFVDSEAVSTLGGRYRFVRPLGFGGMGTVFEVEDLETGAHLALKVMQRSSPSRLLRFKHEFRLVADVRHPNLVRLFDLGFDQGVWFFTMEVVRGQDLRRALLAGGSRASSDQSTLDSLSSAVDSIVTTLDGGAAALESANDLAWEDGQTASPTATLVAGEAVAGDRTLRRPAATASQPASPCDPQAVQGILAQILDGLEHLHQHGIVHGDLKPSNVLIDDGQRVRLADFGLASRPQGLDEASPVSGLAGTVAYLAPELGDRQPPSPATDLYALGTMLFELLTGHLPFRGNPVQMIRARRERPAPRVESLVTGAPRALVALCQGWLETSPEARPSIVEARRQLGLSQGGESSEESAELIGRDAERQALAACLDRARSGGLQLAMVFGDSGLGKSFLAQQLMGSARRLGALCFEGRCFEREQVPFGAFDRVVDGMVRHLAGRPAEVLATHGQALGDLSAIFPVVGLLTGQQRSVRRSWHEAATRMDPQTRTRRAYAALGTLLAEIATETPVLIVVDDLQWAGEESIEMLESLLQSRPAKVMVMALLRPIAGLGERLRAAFDRPALELVLEPLAPPVAQQLLRATAGGVDDRAAATLVREAAGNPFMLTRLARQLGGLDEGADASAWLADTVGELSSEARRLLSLAAVAGGEVDVDVLQQANQAESSSFTLALDELVSERWIEIEASHRVASVGSRASRRVDFYHDKLRQAAYRRLAADGRADLHRTLAETLETRPEATGRYASALCRHWTEAGDRDKGRHWELEAAHQAAAQLAARQATRLYQRYLDDPDPDLPRQELILLWERMGDVAGQGGEWQTAVEAYRRALQQVPEGSDLDRLRILRRFAEAALAAGDLVRALDTLGAGLGLLGLPLERPKAQRLAVLAGLATALELRRRLPMTVRQSREAQARMGFLSAASQALIHLDPLASLELALRHELLGVRLGDPWAIQRALASRTIVLVLGGRIGERRRRRLHRELDRAQALAVEHQLPLGQEVVAVSRALLWLDRDLDRALAESQAALDGIAREGMIDSHEAALARAHHRLVLLQRGDYDRIVALAEREAASSRPNYVGILNSLFFLVILAARQGRLAEAERRLEQLERHRGQTPDPVSRWIETDARVVLLCARGEFAAARRHRSELEPVLQKLATPSSSLLAVRWRLGLLEADLGLAAKGELEPSKRDQAVRHARLLIRTGMLDAPCLGWRAVALLSRHRVEAERALERALVLSAAATTEPYKRWLCLDAARELAHARPEHEAEAELLRERYALQPLVRDKPKPRLEAGA